MASLVAGVAMLVIPPVVADDIDPQQLLFSRLVEQLAFLRQAGSPYLPGRNPCDLDGGPPAGDDDPDRNAPRNWTRFLARAFSDPVDPRTSLAEPDIREPGPDSSDFPNSPYSLPRGWNYLETSPVNYTGSIGPF